MMNDYQIDLDSRPATAVLHGVFRLATPEQYDVLFAPLATGLDSAAGGYTVDLTDVVLMNSSGLRALADLVLAARRSGTSLTFLGKADVPWHSKTVASFKPLYAGLTVKL
ncbi:MAG: hypothetical protein ACREPM_08540, partial [Gemmatimonadaceae bacterium]